MYKLTKPAIEGKPSSSVLTNNGLSAIPFAPDNTDYQQFLKDIKEGVELQDAEGVTMSAEQATQFVKELP